MKIKKYGFTLVEIMIVVAIIALLAMIAIPNLMRARVNSNDAVAQANLKTIATAMESYANVNSNYPTTTTALIGIAPPYLGEDFFTGIHDGFSYDATLTSFTYSVVATPAGTNLGSTTYTITTGGVLTP